MINVLVHVKLGDMVLVDQRVISAMDVALRGNSRGWVHSNVQVVMLGDIVSMDQQPTYVMMHALLDPSQ